MLTDGGERMPDGGEASGETDRASAFVSEAEYEWSKLDVIREMYDRKFYAPLQIVLADYRGIFGIGILLMYLLMGTVGVAVIAFPRQTGGRFDPWFTTWSQPLGTDHAGRPLHQMVVHATPGMIQLMIGGALFAMLFGILIGTVAGFKRGNIEYVLMTLTDTAAQLPGLPLLIVLVAVFEPRSPFLVGLILSINAWPGTARALRAQVIEIREKEYVEATRAMGGDSGEIIQREVMPELMPYVTIGFMGSLTGIIYAAVGLYFLGILPVEWLNWGVMLDNAYSEVNFRTFTHMHYLVVALVVISLVGLGATLTAQAMDRVFNPRLRAKHAKTIRGSGPEDAIEEEDEDVTDTFIAGGN